MTDINHDLVDNITCPKCGSENGDSGYEDNEGLNVCDDCGTCFEHQRNLTVTYSTSILEYPTPIKEAPKPFDKELPSWTIIVEDNRITIQEWTGTEKQLQALQDGRVFEGHSAAEKYIFLKNNMDTGDQSC